MTVSVVSLGCPKNLVDSEHILGILAQSGYQLSALPGSSDVVIINTCGFLRSAVEEAERVIGYYLGLKQVPNQKDVVAGCLVQRAGERLRQAYPEVAAFVGIDQIDQLPGLIAGRGHDPESRRFGSCPRLPQGLCNADVPRLVSTPRHYAYLRIADGCDNCCSYCLIPSIRGRLRSRELEDVVREGEMLVRNGARELILIAQDTTIYGQDRYGRKMLAPLLRRLGEIDGVAWLRVLYTHPAHYDDEFLDELAANPKVVKYVDLPLQHINDRVLARMNRPYGQEEVRSLLARLGAIPSLSIRTTFITGFPGETEREFRELRDFAAEGHFAHLGCFAFSPEPGTRAARLPGQLPEAEREARAREIMGVQRRVARARNRRRLGQEVEVVIDTPGASAREFLGRSAGDAPEIDDVVHIRGQGLRCGDFLKVRIEQASAFDLDAIPVERK